MDPDDLTTPDAPASGAAVFVDSSGRRATRIRRVASLLVLLCLGYGVALLIAALTGVPIKGAIVPYPALGSSTHTAHSGKVPQHTPTGSTAGGAGSPLAPGQGSATAGTAPTATSTKAAHSTQSNRATTSATPSAGATPTASATKTRGKSSTAPGASNRPTSHPTKTATAHGHSGKP